MAFSYVVRVTVEGGDAFDRYLSWLRDPHVGDVCAAGAESAELVLVDVPPGAPRVVEAHYRFPSREAFAVYERAEAPRLRAEGLRVVEELGIRVRFERATGEIL